MIQTENTLPLSDKTTRGEIVLYQPNDNIKLEVRLDKETVWLTQQQIADLFGVKQPAISKHIANIYKSGELEEVGTYSILEYMGNEDKQLYSVKAYNLDVILSVGYRVKSKKGIIFRRWANNVLKDYLIKGYAVNNPRLKYLGQIVDLVKIATRGNDRIPDRELREILEVINNYSIALDMLDDYDHKSFSKIDVNNSDKKIKY